MLRHHLDITLRACPCAGTLWAALQQGKYHDEDGMPKLRALLTTAIEVCEGMAYMHSHRVVHRDLTSGNILLMNEPVAQCVKAKVTPTLMSCACRQVSVNSGARSLLLTYMGSQSLCKSVHGRSSLLLQLRGHILSQLDEGDVTCQVSDFGLSMLMKPGQDQARAMQHGTLAYMPPELIMDDALSFATDVYSFGILLWEMFMAKVLLLVHASSLEPSIINRAQIAAGCLQACCPCPNAASDAAGAHRLRYSQNPAQLVATCECRMQCLQPGVASTQCRLVQHVVFWCAMQELAAAQTCQSISQWKGDERSVLACRLLT